MERLLIAASALGTIFTAKAAPESRQHSRRNEDSPSFLPIDMIFATLGMEELVEVRLLGNNPLKNIGVFYTGSLDDDTLNAARSDCFVDNGIAHHPGGSTGKSAVAALCLAAGCRPGMSMRLIFLSSRAGTW